MTVADVRKSRISVWEALSGHRPGRSTVPADPGLWAAVVERLDPTRARPVLRPGIERADLVSARDTPYTMLRSPDGPDGPHYLRIAPDEAALVELVDGELTVAQLVGEFARISGRLAPDQVTRLVADLAANRMLEELPDESYQPAEDAEPPPVRWGRTLLSAVRGRRIVLGDPDAAVSLLHRAGGRWLFNPAAAGIVGMLALAGLALFVWTWWQGTESVFLTGGSYASGAAILIVLHVLGLAAHEVGHALAAKHAGRRVSAFGVVLHFGVPALFLDTSDVWLASRRARLLTTAAGPVSALAFAGFFQIVGLLWPPLAGVAFALAFVVYVATLVCLNPLLPLDGHYLLADWLEVPNLRSRAVAWLRARARVHRPMPPLDGEGRLIALYGGAALLWLAVTAVLAWRVWDDRISGATTGLDTAGWADTLLVLLALLVLAAPLVYAVVGTLVRLAGPLLHRRAAARAAADDQTRRRAVLRSSALGELPLDTLDDLAARSVWLHPHRGQRVVRAGAVQPYVLVVADGAVEARMPDDPSGTVRQRVGLGGVIGLAGALTGTPSALTWHTVGTTLLAVPAPAVAAAVGPLPGPSPAERAEAEALFAETPALETLPAEDRMALAAVAVAQDLGAGEPVHLRVRNSCLVIGDGVIVLPEGTALRRGTMIGPVDADLHDPVAFTRTEVRLFTLPPVAKLPTLLGGGGPGEDMWFGAKAAGAGGAAADPAADGGRSLGRAAGQAPVIGGRPRAGLHPVDDYPPLAAPPGPPPDHEEAVDKRFERGLWGLVGALAVLVVVALGGVALPGPAWAEMPADRAMLTGVRGPVTATVGGRTVEVDPGDRLYVAAGDRVDVGATGRARLTFRGGSGAVLCPDSHADLAALGGGADGRPIRPTATLVLTRGRLLADTATPSRSFDPLALTVESQGQAVVSEGSAWYVVGAGGAKVSTGQVRRDGEPLPMTSAPLTCLDGVPVSRPSETPAEEEPSPTAPPPPPVAQPSGTPAPGQPEPRDEDGDGRPDRPRDPGDPGGGPGPTGGGTTGGGNPPPPGPPPPGPPPPLPPPPPPPPPANEPPTISWTDAPGGTLAQQGGPDYCAGGSSSVSVSVAVSDDGGADNLSVTLSWNGFEVGGSGMSGGATRSGTVGPVDYPGQDNGGGSLGVEVEVSDGEFVRRVTGSVAVAPCEAPPPPAG